MDVSFSDYILGVIPARWGSTRFPGKPLHKIAGKTLVQRVWDQVQKCKNIDKVIIATDDERIAEEARSFGAEVVMTSNTHPSGTDRIAEVCSQMPKVTHAINIQGDEPLISPELVDALAEKLKKDSQLKMVTAATELKDYDKVVNPNIVKVVLSNTGNALYFSRSPIPFNRDKIDEVKYYQHKGIYGYSVSFLKDFVKWGSTSLERLESLEQLRALENNVQIQVVITDDESEGVDTLEQALELEKTLNNQK